MESSSSMNVSDQIQNAENKKNNGLVDGIVCPSAEIKVEKVSKADDHLVDYGPISQ